MRISDWSSDVCSSDLEGEVLLPYTQAKQVLDRLKKTAIGRDFPDAEACARFDKDTRLGRDMESYQSLLARAVASIAGKSEERAIASLFPPGGTHALKGEFPGINDFVVVAFVVILPPAASEGVLQRMEACAPSLMLFRFQPA